MKWERESENNREWERMEEKENPGLPQGGKSRYWKAIKLAFSRIDWKWRGLLKPRDKGTIVCFWPPYVALLSPSCWPPWGGAPYPVCLNTPGPKREVSEGFSTSWIDPSLSTTGTLFSYLNHTEIKGQRKGKAEKIGGRSFSFWRTSTSPPLLKPPSNCALSSLALSEISCEWISYFWLVAIFLLSRGFMMHQIQS